MQLKGLHMPTAVVLNKPEEFNRLPSLIGVAKQ
jgi:hypothetical protein